MTVFTGIKVLDVASFVAGPVAATILSDSGADVTKNGFSRAAIAELRRHGAVA